MTLSARQNRILATLQSGPASANYLGQLLDAPNASVRRDVQVLRAAGHRIDDARDNDGLYRFTA